MQKAYYDTRHPINTMNKHKNDQTQSQETVLIFACFRCRASNSRTQMAKTNSSICWRWKIKTEMQIVWLFRWHPVNIITRHQNAQTQNRKRARTSVCFRRGASIRCTQSANYHNVKISKMKNRKEKCKWHAFSHTNPSRPQLHNAPLVNTRTCTRTWSLTFLSAPASSSSRAQSAWPS